jgi:hypothetical protein
MAGGVLRHIMAARRLQPPGVERWRTCPRAHRWLGIGRRRAVRRRGRRLAAEHGRRCSRPAAGTGGKLQSARLGLGLQRLRSRAPWSHMRCSSWLVAVCDASCSATRAVTRGRARSSAQPCTQGSAHCPHWNVAFCPTGRGSVPERTLQTNLRGSAEGADHQRGRIPRSPPGSALAQAPRRPRRLEGGRTWPLPLLCPSALRRQRRSQERGLKRRPHARGRGPQVPCGAQPQAPAAERQVLNNRRRRSAGKGPSYQRRLRDRQLGFMLE